MSTEKFAVWTKSTPGAQDAIVGVADTLKDARSIAERYQGRKDLTHQDVEIRHAGKLVERCGPCR